MSEVKNSNFENLNKLPKTFDDFQRLKSIPRAAIPFNPGDVNQIREAFKPSVISRKDKEPKILMTCIKSSDLIICITSIDACGMMTFSIIEDKFFLEENKTITDYINEIKSKINLEEGEFDNNHEMIEGLKKEGFDDPLPHIKNNKVIQELEDKLKGINEKYINPIRKFYKSILEEFFNEFLKKASEKNPDTKSLLKFHFSGCQNKDAMEFIFEQIKQYCENLKLDFIVDFFDPNYAAISGDIIVAPSSRSLAIKSDTCEFLNEISYENFIKDFDSREKEEEDLQKIFSDILKKNSSLNPQDSKNKNARLELQNLSKLSYETKIMLVGPWEYFFSSLDLNDPDILIGHGAKTQLILSIFDPETKTSGMIYLSIIEDELELKDGFFFDKNNKKIEKSKEDVIKVLENFYKFTIKKFLNEFFEKNDERAKKLQERNQITEGSVKKFESDKKKSLVEIHLHGCENKKIVDLIEGEIHSQCPEKFELKIKSFNFNFDEDGNPLFNQPNKTFAIDCQNGEYYTKISKKIISEFFKKRDFNDYADLEETNQIFNKKLEEILNENFDVFKIAKDIEIEKPKTFLEKFLEIFNFVNQNSCSK
jgi:hypothetical protein